MPLCLWWPIVVEMTNLKLQANLGRDWFLWALVPVLGQQHSGWVVQCVCF